MDDMIGKTVVMTGATSGIGAVAAERLAERGARLVLIARERRRADALLGRIRQGDHRIHLADLSRLSEMKRVGTAIAEAETRIDVLVNNAGAIFGHREVTEDGLEKTFATNHMAYFVLTLALREALQAAGNARVVSTASVAHVRAQFDLADLQTAQGYGPMKAYARSKLCNILFTRELARRWAPLGITANCFHPGIVKTRIGNDGGFLIGIGARLVKAFGIPPEKGAETLVHLAASPEGAATSGEYFVKKRVAETTAAARNEALASDLWAASLGLAGWAKDAEAIAAPHS